MSWLPHISVDLPPAHHLLRFKKRALHTVFFLFVLSCNTSCGQAHQIRKTVNTFVDAVNSGNEAKILKLLSGEDQQFIESGSKTFRAISGTTTRTDPTDLIATSSSAPPLNIESLDIVHIHAGPPETATVKFIPTKERQASASHSPFSERDVSTPETGLLHLRKEEGEWRVLLNLSASQSGNRL